MQDFRIRGDTLLDVVYDNLTGKIIRADSLAQDNDEGLKLRERVQKHLHRDTPLFRCPICHKPVKLRASIDKMGQYFIHETVEGNCPYLQERGLSQDEIRARNFNGQKESPAHKETKAWLAECLKADSSFSDVMVERRFTSSHDSKSYRVPDVRATLHSPEGDLVVAFEIQLSSTFLTEIVGRREFYLDEEALLIWVSRNFEECDPQMTQHDIVAPNNMNAFVINADTHTKSLAEGKLHMECHWIQPTLAEDEASFSKVFCTQMISFHDLKLTPKLQHAVFYDYEASKATLLQRITHQAERRVVDQYLSWCTISNQQSDNPLCAFIRLCRQKQINLPKQEGKLISVTQHLASARAGTPVGHHFNKLIECAHKVIDSHTPFFFYFRAICTFYNWDNRLIEQDINKRRPWEGPLWKPKVDKAWKQMQRSGSIKEYYDDSFRDLVLFMFPEIEPTLDKKVNATRYRLRRNTTL
ncbi:DUF6035 family protein [Pseudodesulfovibrio sp.]|uniref:DUF6035 family protein n=1 Tax=Pseudodesulfovibrio sp. TaxID=2035812 RepID=UPI0026317A90|nr:DUF6035 family protein [Pseudodesulfovibrio sp.]MDD3312999.1 DUF6035 family protein [Pseudodesulfovibrio sp.]